MVKYSSSIESYDDVGLPTVTDTSLTHINSIMEAFGVPRDMIASDEEIMYAWNELPREIRRIPPESRDIDIVKMCVAISVGLFDGAINYVWNKVIVTLKSKVINFGLALVSKTLGKTISEEDINGFTDATLLDLCYKLELLSEEGYYFLNQCRDMRNNFSTAHPSIAPIDDREVINYISRCCKYGITYEDSLRGIPLSEFIDAIKGRKMTLDRLKYWGNQLADTFSAQRQLLVPTLLGIYCDSDSSVAARFNALEVCVVIKESIDAKTKSAMIDQYNEYSMKGSSDKITAARNFFVRLNMLNLLSSAEKHSMISSSCKNLMDVHLAFNNFYNEPPFAARLKEISAAFALPNTVQEEYVYTVIMCYVGNPYGVSHAAEGYYIKMIQSFSPREINYMLEQVSAKSLLSERINKYPNCKDRYLKALNLIDAESMNASQQTVYKNIKKQL